MDYAIEEYYAEQRRVPVRRLACTLRRLTRPLYASLVRHSPTMLMPLLQLLRALVPSQVRVRDAAGDVLCTCAAAV